MNKKYEQKVKFQKHQWSIKAGDDLPILKAIKEIAENDIRDRLGTDISFDDVIVYVNGVYWLKEPIFGVNLIKSDGAGWSYIAVQNQTKNDGTVTYNKVCSGPALEPIFKNSKERFDELCHILAGYVDDFKDNWMRDIQ